jgi:hypothetical protein
MSHQGHIKSYLSRARHVLRYSKQLADILYGTEYIAGNYKIRSWNFCTLIDIVFS